MTRSIDIAAPPDKVFAIVGDPRRFKEFSPWSDIDPDIKYTYEGPESGVGQVMRWSSDNADVGSGSQTITKYETPTSVESGLDFGMRGQSSARFDLVPSTAGTNVTWTFNSDLEGIPAKWFGLMFDRWIGKVYEKGLARLKVVAETPAPVALTEPEPLQREKSRPICGFFPSAGRARRSRRHYRPMASGANWARNSSLGGMAR